MSFKKPLSLTVIVSCIFAALFLSMGCDRFLRNHNSEDSKASDMVNINFQSVDCLKSTPQKLNSFLNDEADSKALTEAFGCIQNSLKEFQRLTRGSQSEGYQVREIQFFFNRYLLTESRISDSFVSEIFKLKVAVVGGSSDFVTRNELDLFSRFLGEFQAEALKISGSFKLLFFSRSSPSVQPGEIEKLQEKLQSMGQFFLAHTKLSSSRYQWVDMINLLQELNLFIGKPGSLNSVLKWIPLAESIKILFIGENAKLVSAQDWSEARTWAVSTYMTAIRFFYQIKDHELKTPGEWKNLVAVLDQTLHLIESSPTMKERKILESEAIDRLIDEVFKLNLFHTVVTADLLKSNYRKALIHFIDSPMGRGEAIRIDGLSDIHFKILKQEYQVWKSTQNFIIFTFANSQNQNLQSLQQNFAQYPISKTLQDSSISVLEKDEVLTAWKDFGSLMGSRPAVTYNAKIKMSITPQAETLPLSFVSANMMNCVRSLVRLVHRGYGEKVSQNLFQNRLSMDGLIHLEEDFHEFAVKIGFVDPREKDAAKKTFREGNFFTFHGDGDDWLRPMETYELLSMLISGGRTQLGEIYSDLQARACLLKELDVFGKPLVTESCFSQAFRSHFSIYFDHMPALLQFVSRLSPAEWNQFYLGILSISKSSHNPISILDSSEIRTMTTMLSFIESLMLIYDVDHNSKLSEAEVLAAAPRFRSYIASISPLKDKMVDDIFLYLVFEGAKPSGGWFAGAADLAGFEIKRLAGLGEVSRMNLIQLLVVLKDNVH